MTEAASTGALASAGVNKLYMPTALLKQQLPSGMGSIERVPSMADGIGDSYASRLEEYVNAIRATARIFEQYDVGV